MKYAREFVTSTLVGGLLIVVPVYLAVLLLLKGMKSVASLVRPFAALLPDWIPAERFFSLLLLNPNGLGKQIPATRASDSE